MIPSARVESTAIFSSTPWVWLAKRPAICTYSPRPGATIRRNHPAQPSGATLGELVELETDYTGEMALIDDAKPSTDDAMTCMDAEGYIRNEYYDRKTGRLLLSIYRARTPKMPALARGSDVVSLTGEGCNSVRFDLAALAREDRNRPDAGGPRDPRGL